MHGLTDPVEFVQVIRNARCNLKEDFIRDIVSGKSVLDLGVVAHDINFAVREPGKWLHGKICNYADSAVGVDSLENEVILLNEMGYKVICGDALSVKVGEQFDVVVCGDLIEHIINVEALLSNISLHLKDEGVAVITTPNPLAINRFFNILFDGFTPINYEHTCWYCPQTLFQLVRRLNFEVVDFCWLETDFPMHTKHRYWGPFFNVFGKFLWSKNSLLRNDFGLVFKKV